MNFQSVMDKPDRVNRVTPPSTTMLNTQAAEPKSHAPTHLRAWGPPVTSSFKPSLLSELLAAKVDIFLKVGAF